MKEKLKKYDSNIAFTLFIPCLLIKIVRQVVLFLFPKNELIVRPGGMGDLILLTKALGDKRNHYIFLIEKRSEIWAKHLQLNYICYDKNPIKLFFLPFNFKQAFNTEQLYALSNLITWSILPFRAKLISFKTNRFNFLSKTLIDYSHERHELDQFKLMFNINKQEDFPKEKIKPLVGIYYSGRNQESRSFTAQEWANFAIKHLPPRVQVELYSAPEDFMMARKIKEKMQNDASIFTDFSVILKRIKKCAVVLTVDSAPVHICTFYNIPCIAIFTSGRINKWKPLSNGSVVISNYVPCSPCTKFGITPPCSYLFRCKKVIDD